MQVKCPKAKPWCVDVDSPQHPLLSRHPHHTSSTLSLCGSSQLEKNTPLNWLVLLQIPLFPHITCVFTPYLSYGAPQKSTSASPIFFSQKPCFFSIELQEQREEISSNCLNCRPQGLCSVLNNWLRIVWNCLWLLLSLKLCPGCQLHCLGQGRVASCIFTSRKLLWSTWWHCLSETQRWALTYTPHLFIHSVLSCLKYSVLN